MRSWTTACGLLALASALLWAVGGPAGSEYPMTQSLAWDAAARARRPWTLWTASLVQLSGAHLLANVLALGAVAVLGRSLSVDLGGTLALLVAWPLVALGLVFSPRVTAYAGLSGLIHAAVGVLWAQALFQARSRPLSFVLFAGLGLKLATEHAWLQPVAFDPNWGFNVVYAAHLTGAVAGAALGLCAMGLRTLRRRRALTRP